FLNHALKETVMPFVRAFVPQSLSDVQIRAVSQAVHQALVDAFKIPPKDRFQVITRHAPSELVCAPEYLGIEHSETVALIQITAKEGRTVEMKKHLFERIAKLIDATGAVRASDVIISLVENKEENWSFGNGIAQYAV
ncbi:MAG: tautomerase family protein, partial [Rhodoferax sp.]